MNLVLDTLLPVFLMIALGYLLAKRRFISEGMLTELNRLLSRICLPH